ncbi:beta-ketoacyl-ACP synthase III [Serpentinicella sp. ANB-PHB4]|uniref:beta-ketoacyl-ACP synthase III n=1 Tax=Serpentinicella sp. ANB-PHB4 TaxID=3074076 RepID=UPI00285E0CB5|nr:beta-ketoacyl-ACP synthase III [Serpentinicella sp. ANB-PHB4]MDR5658298.1 beta-ketoacyl-ACP synthase III [Serpentinicella sp. ANB-PHB4]
MESLNNAKISGTGSYVPEKIITNNDLERIVETTDEWIATRTGIKQRRIADDNVATSDLATEASKKALLDANLSAKDLDLIIVATATPDMSFPSTACIVQKNLGAYNAAAFDIGAACTGFIYAITLGNQFIRTGMYHNVLVIGAETLSRIINWEDRDTCVLFGDGAGAVVLQKSENDCGIISSYLGADGENGHTLTQPAGGSRLPASIETIESKLHYIKMDGNEVFKFAVRAMEKSALRALVDSNLSLDEIDFLIPHQANIRIIEAAAKRLKLSMDKVYVNLNLYGNMSAASVPVALDEAAKKGFLTKGSHVLIVGFGGGLTWGASIIKWTK